MKPVNDEIGRSFATGAKAFALGAVLILVASTVRLPDAGPAGAFLGFDGAVLPPPPAAQKADAPPPAPKGLVIKEGG